MLLQIGEQLHEPDISKLWAMPTTQVYQWAAYFELKEKKRKKKQADAKNKNR